MQCLAIDCSGTGCGVAIIADGVLLVRQSVDAPQSEALIPLVGAALAAASLDWSRIGLIGVTIGPGRFTSLRVGLAAARGLGLAANIPVAGVTTTEAWAAGTAEADRAGRIILAAVDGGRADLFVQAFDAGAGNAGLGPLGPIVALMPEEAARLVAGPALLTGDAAKRLIALMPDALVSQDSARPDPFVVAGLAWESFRKGKALAPSPLYLLPPDVTPAKSPARPSARPSARA